MLEEFDALAPTNGEPVVPESRRVIQRMSCAARRSYATASAERSGSSLTTALRTRECGVVELTFMFATTNGRQKTAELFTNTNGRCQRSCSNRLRSRSTSLVNA